MTYDYKEGKKRVQDILNNKLDINEGNIPGENAFTYENAYFGWVTAIFIDIRKSSELFSNEDKVQVSKIIRSFTSEIIEILKDSTELREIGIRGDCVYGIYNTAHKWDIHSLCVKAADINTFMTMLNELLSMKNYPNIDAGIGMSSAQELVVKAGRKGTGISNNVWIGEAVTKASNLSSLGNKNGIQTIVMAEITYNNVIERLVKGNGEAARSWFTYKSDHSFGSFYHSDLKSLEFRTWIEGGMQ